MKFKNGFMKTASILAILFVSLPALQFFLPTASAADGFDDVYEENDNIAEAWEFSYNEGYISGMNQSDDDWYYYEVNPHDKITVNIYYTESEAIMNVSLYNSSENLLATEIDYGFGHKRVEFINSHDQNEFVYLKVFGNNSMKLYDLDAYFDYIFDLEPNNILEDASKLHFPGFFSGGIQENNDWYEIWVEANKSLHVFLRDSSYSNAINISLFDNTNLKIASPYETTNENNRLQWINPNNYDIPVYLLVNGTNEGFNYELELDLMIDIEPNNLPSEAVELPYPGNYNDGMFQEGYDYYKLFLNHGDYVKFYMYNPNYGSYDINMTLLNSSLAPISLGYDEYSDGNVFLDYNHYGDGQWYYILIDGDHMGGEYSLEYYYLIDIEPNNDFGSASTIYHPGNYDRNWLGEEDWFRYNVSSGEEIEVRLNDMGSSEPMYFEIYNSTNDPYMTSWEQDGSQYASFTNYDSDQFYYIRVYTNGMYMTYGYQLEIKSPFIELSDDWLEENDALSSATWIGPSHYDLIQMDPDWFNTTIPGGDLLEISLNFNGMSNDIDLYLYDQYGTEINSSTGIEGWEYVSYYAENTMNVSFLVTGNGNGEPYCMDVSSSYIPIGPSDDGFEENDDREHAAWISSGYYSDLYQGDDDWYNISVSPGYVLDVELWFNGANNDIDLEFYDYLGNPIGGSYSVSDYESYSFNIVQDWQNIYIRVYGYGNFEQYSMDVEVYMDTDDWMEPNDYDNEANFLNLPFGAENLRNFDDDWYDFHLLTNDYVDIYFNRMDTTNPLQVEIWTQSWNLVYNVTVWGPHTINVENYDIPSDYRMRVSGYNVGDSYDLEISLNGIGVNSDDWFEPNDNSGESIGLILPFEDWGLRSFNEDWYDIYLASGDYIDLYVWNSNSADNLRLVVFDPYWNEIKNQTIYEDSNGPIYINPAESGTYYILITSEYNEFYGNHYDLRIDLNGQQFNNDDWAEPNDIQTNAYQLSNNDYYNDLVCKNEDWFYFGPILNQETLTVKLEYNKQVNNLGIELFDATGTWHGFQITEESWGKTLTWTAGGNYNNVFLLISGDYDTLYTLDIRVGGSTSPQDDWAEENDDINSAKEIPFDRHNGLTQLDLDWYKVWLYPMDSLTVDLYYDTALPGNWMDVELFEMVNGVENKLLTGTFNNGYKSLSWTNGNEGKNIYIKVNGRNLGDWYDLDIKVNGGGSPTTPSMDWIAFNTGDWAEWDATFEIFSEGGDSAFYNGSLRGDINSAQLSDHSVKVGSNMQWNNIPTEYLQGWIQGTYDFDIEGDGFAYPAYFGFASVFVGKGFHYSESQPIFSNLFDTTYTILDEGRTLEVEYNPSDGPYYKMRITYSEDGLLKEIVLEGDFVDATGTIFAKGKVNLILSSSSFMDETKTDDTNSNSTDGGDNPFEGFDFSSIPGFPTEIIGSVLGLTIIAMIVVVKKKSKKGF